MKKKSPALIFISYARENYEQAKKIQNYLESNSQVTWLDKTDVYAGDAWEKNVRDYIKRSSFFIALLSKASLNKPEDGRDRYVSLEFDLALRLRRESGKKKPHIIPVRLDEVKIPVEFEHLHCLDFSLVTLEEILLRIEDEHKKRIYGYPPSRGCLIMVSFVFLITVALACILNWPWRSKLLFKATIFDSATNQHLAGAYVYLLGPKGDTIYRSGPSGERGQITFELDTTGEFQTTIKYVHPGYKTVSKSIKLMAHDTYRSVRLAKKPGSDSSTKPLQPSDKSQGPG